MVVADDKKGALPRSLRADVMHARDEAKLAPYREMTPHERVKILAAACRTAIISLNLHPDPLEILRMRAPLPESSRRLWDRLRQEYRLNARER